MKTMKTIVAGSLAAVTLLTGLALQANAEVIHHHRRGNDEGNGNRGRAFELNDDRGRAFGRGDNRDDRFERNDDRRNDERDGRRFFRENNRFERQRVGRVGDIIGNTLRLRNGNRTIVVRVNAGTEMRDRDGDRIHLQDLRANDLVKVHGLLSGLTMDAREIETLSR